MPSADNQQGRLDEKLTPDYLVGLVDGEGYFSVSVFIDHSKNYLSRRVKMVFGIDLNITDGKILYDIRDWFGCGDVRLKIDKRERFSHQLQYQISDRKLLKKVIIPFFKKHPLKLTKRKITFNKFVEMLELIENKVHLSEKGFVRVRNLAQQLHDKSPQRLHAEPHQKVVGDDIVHAV